jgi:hypothetical protein
MNIGFNHLDKQQIPVSATVPSLSWRAASTTEEQQQQQQLCSIPTTTKQQRASNAGDDTPTKNLRKQEWCRPGLNGRQSLQLRFLRRSCSLHAGSTRNAFYLQNELQDT